MYARLLEHLLGQNCDGKLMTRFVVNLIGRHIRVRIDSDGDADLG